MVSGVTSVSVISHRKPATSAAAAGDFSRRGDAQRFDHDFRLMLENLNAMMAVSDDNLGKLSQLLSAIAEWEQAHPESRPVVLPAAQRPPAPRGTVRDAGPDVSPDDPLFVALRAIVDADTQRRIDARGNDA